MISKLTLVILLISSSLALHLKSEASLSSSVSFNSSRPRIRKSILALDPVTRKGYFWSLKMLAVLPPPPTFDYRVLRSFIAKDGEPFAEKSKFCLKPTCIHDILIAAHITASEHVSFYFPTFHRHWIVFYEIWLSFAHDILRGGKEKLLKHYPADLYTNHSRLWDVVFAQYRLEGMADVEEMAAHYWNPTDYKHPEDVVFPDELSTPKDPSRPVLDSMDKLFLAVREQYPWDFHAKNRLVSQTYKWNQTEVVERLRTAKYFNNLSYVPRPYSANEVNLLEGKLSAREQPEGQNFDTFRETFAQFLLQTNSGDGDYKDHAAVRNEDYFNTVGNKTRIPCNRMTEGEVFVNYGVEGMQLVDGDERFVKHSYISKAERRQLNIPYHNAIYYNKRFPHYTYGYALFNKLNVPTYLDFISRMDVGINSPHMKMHGYRGLTFQEILGLHIFIFHAGVQFLMEMRIRKDNFEDERTGTKHQFSALKKTLMEVPRDQQSYMFKKMIELGNEQTQAVLTAELNKEMHGYFTQLYKRNGSEFAEPPNENSTGYYGVFEWIYPLLEEGVQSKVPFNLSTPNFTTVFPSRDFMITPQRIRSGLDLDNMYRRIYADEAQERFEGIANLSTRSYNFDFEVYNGPGSPKQLLDWKTDSVPEYLLNMRVDVEEETYDVFDSNINSTIDALYSTDYSLFNNINPVVDALYNADPQGNRLKVKSYLITHYTAYLHNATYSFAQYPAYKADGQYEIRLSVDPTLDCSDDVKAELQSYGLTVEEIEQITSEGIAIQNLTVSKSTSPCVDCPLRRKFLDADVDILEANFRLWKALRQIMVGDAVLASSQDMTVPFAQCFGSNIKLSAVEDLSEGEQPIEAWAVRGVEEFTLTVKVSGGNPEGRLTVTATVASGSSPNDALPASIQSGDAVDGMKYFCLDSDSPLHE